MARNNTTAATKGWESDGGVAYPQIDTHNTHTAPVRNSETGSSTTYNRVLDRVRVAVNDTRGHRALQRVFSLALARALPILAGDNVRGAGPHLRLPSTAGQLSVRLLHRCVLQDQTLDLLPLCRPLGDGRVSLLLGRVDSRRNNAVIIRVIAVNAARRRFIRILVVIVPRLGRQRLHFHRPSESKSGGGRQRRRLQLLALPISIRSHFSRASLRVAGLVPTVSAARVRVQQGVLLVRAVIARRFLAFELLRGGGLHVRIGLLREYHARWAFDHRPRHRRLQCFLVANERAVLATKVRVITVAFASSSVVDGGSIRPVLLLLSRIFVQDGRVLVLYARSRAVQLGDDRRTSRGRFVVTHVVVHRRHSSHPGGQSLQEIGTRVAEQLGDARGRRRTRVTTPPPRRALTRRRHVVARREDEHRDVVSTTPLSLYTPWPILEIFYPTWMKNPLDLSDRGTLSLDDLRLIGQFSRYLNFHPESSSIVRLLLDQTG